MINKHLHRFLSILFSLAISSIGDSAQFMGLGGLPEGTLASYSNAISADGTVVVGSSRSTLGTTDHAFRWSLSDGMQRLTNDFDGITASKALAVSGNGSIIIGEQSGSNAGSFRWTQADGYQLLSFNAQDISSDGNVIIGEGPDTIAFYWTESSGIVSLGVPTGVDESRVYGLSADGSVIVGVLKTNTPTGDLFEAYRWTEQTGFFRLGDLSGGVEVSNAYAVSGDGLVVVGESYSSFGQQGFRWTEGSGLVALDDLLGSKLSAIPYATSFNGSVIVGTVNDGPFATFIWTELSGVRNLQDYLHIDLGLDLTGWSLTNAFGISANGKVICGDGINPDGEYEAWVAIIPEPTSVSLGILLLTATLLIRQKH